VLDKRRVELLLDRIAVTAVGEETDDEAVERWWRENADRLAGAETFPRPVVDVCRSL